MSFLHFYLISTMVASVVIFSDKVLIVLQINQIPFNYNEIFFNDERK